MGMVFSPLQLVAFATLPGKLRTDGTALMNLVRNIGSAIGISVTTTVLSNSMQAIHSQLTAYATPFNRALGVNAPYAILRSAAADRARPVQRRDRNSRCDRSLCKRFSLHVLYYADSLSDNLAVASSGFFECGVTKAYRHRYRSGGDFGIMRAAFIGLGVMGYPMAGHLARAGHAVTVYNRTQRQSATLGRRIWRQLRADAGRSRRASGLRDGLRRTRRGLAQRDVGRGRRLRRDEKRCRLRRSHHGFRDYRARAGRGGRKSRIWFYRCAGFGRRTGRQERPAHHHVRRHRKPITPKPNRSSPLMPGKAA